MSPKRKRTLRGMLALSALAVVWIGYALAIEARAVSQGGNSTISELIWAAWARQPGPIALGLVTLAFWVGVLCGHFFWQSAATYDAIREDRLSDQRRAGLALLLVLLASAASAQEPQIGAWAGRGMVLARPGGAEGVWTASLQGRWPLDQRLTLLGRGEVAGLPERLVAGAPSTYQSGEIHCGLALRVRPGLEAVAVAGTTWRLDGQPQPERPSTRGLGVRRDMPGGGWIYAMLGTHGASGAGLRALLYAHLPLRGGVAIEVDAATGHRDQQWQRIKLVYRIPLPGEGR